jgi:hypothetical protein
MATEVSQPLKLTAPAGQSLASNQYCFVKYNASGQIVPCSVANESPLGVLQNNPNAVGKACEVVVIGITKVVVGGSIPVNSSISTDASGHAVTTGTNAQGKLYGAVAAASGDIATIIIDCARP